MQQRRKVVGAALDVYKRQIQKRFVELFLRKPSSGTISSVSSRKIFRGYSFMPLCVFMAARPFFDNNRMFIASSQRKFGVYFAAD